jgi:hypothetical protein
MAEEAGAAPAVPDRGNTCLANKRDDLASRLSSVKRMEWENGGARGGIRTRTPRCLRSLPLLLGYVGEVQALKSARFWNTWIRRRYGPI